MRPLLKIGLNMQKKIKLNCPFSMLAVKVVETKDHLKSAINLVNQKVRMQRLVEFQLLEFAILYETAAFSVCWYVLHPTVRPRFLRRPPLCDEQYTNSCQGIVFVKLENHAKIFCKKYSNKLSMKARAG